MSPRTEEQFEEIRDQKRMLIINTALELFANNGFHSTSIQKIAKKAVISKGLIYNYFESKEALMYAILDKGIHDMMDLFDTNHDGVLETHELEGFINNSFKIIQENLHFWRLYFSISFQPAVYAMVKEKILEMSKPLMDMSIQYFKSKGFKNPETEAIIFSALLDGIACQYLLNTEEFPVKHVKKTLIDRYCRK